MNTTATPAADYRTEFSILDEDHLCRLLRRRDCTAYVFVRSWDGRGPSTSAKIDKPHALAAIARGDYEGFLALAYGAAIYLNGDEAPAWLVARRRVPRLTREIAAEEERIARLRADGSPLHLSYAESAADRLIETRRQLHIAEGTLARHRAQATQRAAA